MSSPKTQEQSFGSDSSTIAPSSQSSTYKTNPFVADTSNEEFEDISKDIEIGTLPTINPQAVQKATSNNKKAPRSRNSGNSSRNSIYIKNLILTSAISMAIIIPICLPPLYTDELKWSVSVALKNIQVTNSTVDYHNGTIAPLNDANLMGSNLTVETCSFVDAGDLCTNNAWHYIDVWWPCFVIFLALLVLSVWHCVTLRYRSITFRSSGRRGN